MRFSVAWRTVAVAIFATTWLAACSGSPSQSNFSSPSYLPAQAQSGLGLDAVHADGPSQCNNGPLQVSPCYVAVGRGYGRYAQITVKYPGGDQLSQKNNCNRGGGHFHFGKGRIARVHGAGQYWTVTSGTHRGNCTAVFTDWHNGQRTSVSVQIHNSRGRRR